MRFGVNASHRALCIGATHAASYHPSSMKSKSLPQDTFSASLVGRAHSMTHSRARSPQRPRYLPQPSFTARSEFSTERSGCADLVIYGMGGQTTVYRLTRHTRLHGGLFIADGRRDSHKSRNSELNRRGHASQLLRQRESKPFRCQHHSHQDTSQRDRGRSEAEPIEGDMSSI